MTNKFRSGQTEQECLLDIFASAALTGALANQFVKIVDQRSLARWCYEMARQMLKARKELTE